MYTIEPAMMAVLVPLYNSPQRHYHDLNHIQFCFSKLSEYNAIKGLSSKALYTLTYAIWFHDAIYSPYPYADSSNEKESVGLFINCMNTMRHHNSYEYDSQSSIDNAIIQAIEYTEHHSLALDSTAVLDTTLIMLDIDMAGFGRSFYRSFPDSEKIFKEYESLGLPLIDMLQNRVNFLKGLLLKPRIYYTDYFFDTYEVIARDTIASIIEHSEYLIVLEQEEKYK